ncbi:hypothetical protein [Brevibacillus agri]|uniref:hypothetical protein n=1 Tax=Brevibacillus agri TaxID=51101 RepID=UPI003D2068EC
MFLGRKLFELLQVTGQRHEMLEGRFFGSLVASVSGFFRSRLFAVCILDERLLHFIQLDLADLFIQSANLLIERLDLLLDALGLPARFQC